MSCICDIECSLYEIIECVGDYMCQVVNGVVGIVYDLVECGCCVISCFGKYSDSYCCQIGWVVEDFVDEVNYQYCWLWCQVNCYLVVMVVIVVGIIGVFLLLCRVFGGCDED